MGRDNLITPESLAASLKMAAEGMKKKPGVMKSTVGYMELLNTYVERIVTAKEQGQVRGRPTAPSSRSRSTRRWTWWASSTSSGASSRTS